MGSVWVADHLTLRRQVVVKFIAGEFAESPDAARRFEREAALAAQAKSPHVVQIFDHGISQLGLPYIAMELLEGEDLATRMARVGPIEPVVFAGWLRQACRGLGRAHAKGIVHRDIKPENVFLSDHDGEVLVKLLDFGVAKVSTSTEPFDATVTGAVLGTGYYMSPEQVLGERDIDFRSDLWALGVLTYHALSGVRPFVGDSFGQLVLSITSGRYTPLSKHRPRLGAAIDGWMGRAFARDRERRFQSARELADSFEQLAAALGPEPAPAELEATVADTTVADTTVADATVADATVADATVADAEPKVIPAAALAAPVPLGVSTTSPSAHDGGERAALAVEPRSRRKRIAVLSGSVAAVSAIVGFVLGRPAPAPEHARTASTSPLPAAVAASAAPSSFVPAAAVASPSLSGPAPVSSVPTQ